MSAQKKSKVSFGFKEVDYSEKSSLVHNVFESVSKNYDIMNDFMSLFLHRVWKNDFVSKISLSEGCKILDLAGGTGDISFRILKNAKSKNLNIDLTLSDINKHMLSEAKKRALDENITAPKFKVVDACNIDFPDNYFDYVTIAFGIRNVTDIPKALAEIYRVLKPGGQFLCLEFSNVDSKIMSKIYDFYSMNIIPKLGKIVANDEASYQYLVESIRKFPPADEFKKLMENADFSQAKFKKLTEGVVAIHSGWKI
jgi:ubiquinone/menaquinone biosynthesis methyltransferase